MSDRLPATLVGLIASTTLFAAGARPLPAALAIYYGYPSLINGAASDLQAAVAEFGAYDIIVLGAGLERGDHPDHQNTRRILEAVRRTPRRPEVFGYVALRQPLNDAASIERHVQLWASIGVSGIFYDEAGRDFGVEPPHVAHAIHTARRHRLAVCLNAFELSAIEEQQRHAGGPARLNRDDALLVESFAFRLGVRQTPAETAQRMQVAGRLRGQTGVRVFGVTTSASTAPLGERERIYARDLAALFRLDALGWGAADYGAKDSRLDAR